MASTVFVDGLSGQGGTPLVASWFNDVNQFVYAGVLPPGGSPLGVVSGGTGATTASGARTNLGLAIGTNVEAWSAELDSLAALASTGITVRTGSATYAQRSIAVGSSNLTLSNGGGVAGNPTLDLASSPSVSGSLTAGTTVTAGTSLVVTGTSTGKTTINSGLSGASNNTLTLPTTASDTLAALGTAQSFSAVQTFPQNNLVHKGSSTGVTTLNSGLSGAGNNTLTLPTTASDTLAGIGTAQTWTAVQTYTNSDIALLGSSTGKTIFTSANSTASTFTLTFPALTGTLYVSGQGASAAVSVTDGGTGVGTMTTAYAPICAGTTATGALQVASTGLATSGFVLTSNGSSSLPSFQAAASGFLPGKTFAITQSLFI